ncbi:MAG: drug/metabolite exporter YedA, partial [Ktedonobacteraceae bacterium]
MSMQPSDGLDVNKTFNAEDVRNATANPDMPKSRLTIILALITLYIIWGTTYLAQRIALDSFPPFLLAGIRFVIAGSVMLAFLRTRGMSMPTLKQWLGSILIGTLLFLGGSGGVTFAEQWVTSGLAAVATGAMPLWIALFAGLFGRWPTRMEWYGLIVGFAGLLLLNLGHGISATNVLGPIVLLVSPICWAFGSILSQHLAQPKGAMASAAQLLGGGAVLLLVGLGSGEHVAQAPSASAIWAMLFLIGGGSLVGFTTYGYLLSRVRPSLATSYAYVNPIVAVGLGVWFAGEQISLPGILAMLVILGGVVLVTMGRTHK